MRDGAEIKLNLINHDDKVVGISDGNDNDDDNIAPQSVAVGESQLDVRIQSRGAGSDGESFPPFRDDGMRQFPRRCTTKLYCVNLPARYSSCDIIRRAIRVDEA